jgi:acyl-CoA oxidase
MQEPVLKRLSLLSSHLTSTAALETDPLVLTHLDKFFPPEINSKRLALRQELERSVRVLNEVYEGALDSSRYVALLRTLNYTKIDDWVEYAAYNYELSRLDASFTLFVGVHRFLVCESLILLGSEAQKQKYLPGLLNAETSGAWCLSEPDAGSDASGLETEAKVVEGGYLVNGFKKWPGNASSADLMIVFARDTTSNSVIGLIVDAKAPGVTVQDIQHKLAHRGIRNGIIAFKDVFVPQSDRLEKANDFLTGPTVVLRSSRLAITWIPVGLIGRVYEEAVKRLSTRRNEGASLASDRAKLNRILSLFNASFLMVFNLVRLSAEGSITIGQSSLIKAEVSKMGWEAVRIASEIIQVEGLTLDSFVIKALADIETVITGEGAYEISTLVAGRELTGLASFKAPSNKL